MTGPVLGVHALAVPPLPFYGNCEYTSLIYYLLDWRGMKTIVTPGISAIGLALLLGFSVCTPGHGQCPDAVPLDPRAGYAALRAWEYVVDAIHASMRGDFWGLHLGTLLLPNRAYILSVGVLLEMDTPEAISLIISDAQERIGDLVSAAAGEKKLAVVAMSAITREHFGYVVLDQEPGSEPGPLVLHAFGEAEAAALTALDLLAAAIELWFPSSDTRVEVTYIPGLGAHVRLTGGRSVELGTCEGLVQFLDEALDRVSDSLSESLLDTEVLVFQYGTPGLSSVHVVVGAASIGSPDTWEIYFDDLGRGPWDTSQ